MRSKISDISNFIKKKKKINIRREIKSIPSSSSHILQSIIFDRKFKFNGHCEYDITKIIIIINEIFDHRLSEKSIKRNESCYFSRTYIDIDSRDSFYLWFSIRKV